MIRARCVLRGPSYHMTIQPKRCENKTYHRHKSLKEHSERITVSQVYMRTRKITFNQDSNYPKHLANRYVFKFDLKDSTDEDLLISSGNLFHSVGAAKVKDLSPI